MKPAIVDGRQELLPLDLDETVELTEETARWRARDVGFMRGRWSALSKRIPRFTIEDFKATPDGRANPYLRAIIRQPLTEAEQPIPVGVVSHTYQLAQHTDVVGMCFQGLREVGVDTSALPCEVGLTPLGEWMTFRGYFPASFSFKPTDGHDLNLRLECFNSVDGSSRLVVLLSWFRLVCTNGLVIKGTRAVLRDIHNEKLDLKLIPEIISASLATADGDMEHLRGWETSRVDLSKLEDWVDDYLAKQWGKKAACRTLHICRTGADVELLDPFAGGKPSEKEVRFLAAVPGARKPARNLYDVAQALSWVATSRKSADERLEWQGNVPELIGNLWSHPAS